jgi:hypothetical protein
MRMVFYPQFESSARLCSSVGTESEIIVSTIYESQTHHLQGEEDVQHIFYTTKNSLIAIQSTSYDGGEAEGRKRRPI